MIDINILKKADIFKSLEQKILEVIALISYEQIYDTNEKIFTEGEKADRIFLLVEGKISIQMGNDKNLKPVIVDTVSQDEFFGWSAIVDEHAFTASAVATDKSRIVVIDGKELKKLCEINDHIGNIFRKKILSIVSSRVVHLSRKYKELIYSRRRTLGE